MTDDHHQYECLKCGKTWICHDPECKSAGSDFERCPECLKRQSEALGLQFTPRNQMP